MAEETRDNTNLSANRDATRRDANENRDSLTNRPARSDADDVFDDTATNPNRTDATAGTGSTLDPDRGRDENRDPLSGAPGAHPIGTGAGALAGGAAVGAATGAVIGTAAGPIGTAVGTAIGTAVGAIAGGYAGKGIAESINPTDEHAYWEGNYRNRPYVNQGESYEDYRDAYEYGWTSRAKHTDRDFDAAESDLRRDWESSKGGARMSWDRARNAVRDSWDRITHRHNTGDLYRNTGTGTTSGTTGATGYNTPSGVSSSSAGQTTSGTYGATGNLSGASDFDDTYWRSSYSSRPYVRPGESYDTYAPAYRYGSEARRRYGSRSWNEVEPELRNDWGRTYGATGTAWEKVKDAVKDSWDRVTGDDSNRAPGSNQSMSTNQTTRKDSY